MRTRKEIQEEINKLKEMKPAVRAMSAFGDDNHAAIDAQLDVLEDSMDSDEIYDKWDGEDHLLDNATQALYWVEGDDESCPSENWKSLIEE